MCPQNAGAIQCRHARSSTMPARSTRARRRAILPLYSPLSRDLAAIDGRRAYGARNAQTTQRRRAKTLKTAFAAVLTRCKAILDGSWYKFTSAALRRVTRRFRRSFQRLPSSAAYYAVCVDFVNPRCVSLGLLSPSPQVKSVFSAARKS